MQSITLLRGRSLSKLPLYAPSSTIPMMALGLRVDFRRPSFPYLSHDWTNISIGLTWNNSNVRYKFLIRCGNAHNGEIHSNAKIDALKSLLSLVVQPKEKNSLTSMITSTKNEALKLVVEEKYDEALSHMKHLFDGHADVAYEARVAHVQILIHLDEYEKALEFLKNMGNFRQSNSFDARLSLCQAVVHTMLRKDDEATAWWKTYLGISNYDNGNENSNNFLLNAKNLLKPLLSLKPRKVERGSLFSKIIPVKKMALKAVLNGDYKTAEGHMKDLCNDEDMRRKGQEELEAQIAYIQILIYLDKYEEALKRLINIEKQNHFPQTGSDPRPCLYKAIGLTALGKHEDAKIWWKAFIGTIGLFNPNED